MIQSRDRFGNDQTEDSASLDQYEAYVALNPTPYTLNPQP